MCQLCNGTHVVHEINSFSIVFSCCPTCGPISDKAWRKDIEKFQADIRRKKESLCNEI